MSVPQGRPKGCQTRHGAAQRRTPVNPFRGEGGGGRAVK